MDVVEVDVFGNFCLIWFSILEGDMFCCSSDLVFRFMLGWMMFSLLFFSLVFSFVRE